MKCASPRWLSGARFPAALLVVLAVVLPTSGDAQVAREADPFAVAGTDPMELARAVDRQGEDAMIERLEGGGHGLDARLAAIAAAPRARSPEQALAPLARLAAGRDPDLAPAAARAALEIARALDRDELDRREVLQSELQPAVDALHALAGDPSARADIRAAADHARTHLALGGASAPPTSRD